MKHLFLLLLSPSLCFSQVRGDDLVRKAGLAYENGATTPYTGKAYSYFPDGSPQMLTEYKDGQLNGALKSWYKKDVLQMEGTVANGKKTGTWKLYYENGQPKKQTTYQNDLESGEEVFWTENGKLQKKGSYVNGKSEGKYQWYYANGQLKQEGFFSQGKEDSTWKEWYENGKPKMVGHFQNLVKEGEWTWWDESGKITTAKTYHKGLVEASNFDTYTEQMEFFIKKRDYKNALINAELAETTIADKSENNPVYMGFAVFHSRCYTLFSHFRDGERLLLSRLGLSEPQITLLQNAHKEKSSQGLQGLISDLKRKQDAKHTVSTHVVLGLCYNLLGDSVQLQKQQQLAMDKGGMKDWIITTSMELYRLATERYNNYYALQESNAQLQKQGVSEKRELDKAQYLLRAEDFAGAGMIGDKYLKFNEKNLTAVLLKADIEMALGNVENMDAYEKKALAINPNAFKSRERN